MAPPPVDPSVETARELRPVDHLAGIAKENHAEKPQGYLPADTLQSTTQGYSSMEPPPRQTLKSTSCWEHPKETPSRGSRPEDDLQGTPIRGPPPRNHKQRTNLEDSSILTPHGDTSNIFPPRGPAR